MWGSNAFAQNAGGAQNTESIFLDQAKHDINIDNSYTPHTIVDPFQNSSVYRQTSLEANQNTFNADFIAVLRSVGNHPAVERAAQNSSGAPPNLGFTASGQPLGDRQLFSTASWQV
jgi:hypothetical protein